MASVLEPVTNLELTFPDGWTPVLPHGMERDGHLALDYSVAVAPDAEHVWVVAVLASEGEYLLPPPGDETHFVTHFEREIVALGLDPQGDTLRMLLADLSLIAPLSPPLTLGDLLAMLDPPDAPRRRGLVDGRTFLLDIPAGTPALWGDEDHVLWAEGEGFMITGPQGTGKTTVAGNLAFGLAGIAGFEELYGHSVKALPEGKRVLYLALDRPQQIARCLRRMAAGLPEEEQVILAERMLVQQGGELPFDLLREPKALASWAEQLDAGALIVDSTKDLAHELSDEKVAAIVNEAIQACIGADIEVLLLHHNRKANSDNKQPRKLDDVHGSGNLTRGLGSVVCLWGEPGGEEIQVLHLKPLAEVVGPLVVSHNRETGHSYVLLAGLAPAGPKAERRRRVRAFFMEAGGVGQSFTTAELVDAGLGSKRTLLSDLPTYAWLRRIEVSGQHTSWTMIAPLASEGGA